MIVPCTELSFWMSTFVRRLPLTSFRYTTQSFAFPRYTGISCSDVVAFLGFSRLSPTVDGWNPAVSTPPGMFKNPCKWWDKHRIHYQPQLVYYYVSGFQKKTSTVLAKSAQVIQHDTKPRSQFHHVCDIAPTVYEAIGIRFPDHVEVAWGWMRLMNQQKRWAAESLKTFLVGSTFWKQDKPPQSSVAIAENSYHPKGFKLRTTLPSMLKQ